MLAYLPLIQKLLLDHISRRSERSVFSFNFLGMGLMALSFILVIVAGIFVLFALQTYTADLYGEPVSWLITAAVTLFMGSLSLLASHVSRRKKGLVHHIKEEMEDRMTPVTRILEELGEPIKDHPLASVGLALLAGLLAGDKLGDKGTD